MKLKRLITWVAACAAIGGVAALSQIGGAPPRAEASDHDDGELDLKSRSLNLTDHFAFKVSSTNAVGSPPAATDKLALVMYFNPRSLPGRQYFLSQNARYEFHVTKVTGAKTAQAAPKDDFVFRFEASAPQANGTQFITMTVLRDNVVVGHHIGTSSAFGAVTTNSATIDGTAGFNYFVGMRADSFYFDVNRFFQVRAFLAQRFFGGAGGIGDATATLANNCRGDQFLAYNLGVVVPVPDPAKERGGVSDGDNINLWNPPTCAPDFTKNLNVTAIVLTVPKSFLGGGDVYDTWSSISVLQ